MKHKSKGVECISVVCLLMLFFTFNVNTIFAQKHMDTIVVVSEGAFNVTISDAAKINTNPVIEDTVTTMPGLTYGIKNIKKVTAYIPDTIHAAKMTGEPLEKLYKSYVKAGMGNYTTPYFEFFLNSLRSKEQAYGVHMKHLSSAATLKEKGYSGYSDNEINLFAKRFVRKHLILADFDYNRNAVHCYNYDRTLHTVENSVTRQIYNNIGVGVGVESHYKESENKLNHALYARYYNLSDSYRNKENNLTATGNFSMYYLDQKISLATMVDYNNTKNKRDTLNNTIVKFAPSLSTKYNKFKAIVGLGIYLDAGVSNRFLIYPNLDVSYNVIDNIIIPYIGVRGGLTRNNFKSVIAENPFINPSFERRNTEKPYDIYLGLKGIISSEITYDISTAFGKVNNLPLYVTDNVEVLQNRFNIEYDTAHVLNFHAEVGFLKREKFNFKFKGDYFNYSMKHEQQAWHKPAMQLTFAVFYNLRNKISVKLDAFITGTRYAKMYSSYWYPVSAETVELRPWADLNLGLEYRYSKRLSFFANFNNITAARYQKWLNYPVQRFNGMVGGTYSF